MQELDETLLEYERQAKTCRRLAGESGPIERDRLNKLAGMWDKLADERRERLEKRPGPANENQGE